VSKIKSIVVCVEYDDFLAITLPKNRNHFSETLVVTSLSDERTLKLAHNFNCSCLATNAFYTDGAHFNKGLAMEEGFDALGRDGWICVWDADIIMPQNIEVMNKKTDCLYSPGRHILEDPKAYPHYQNESSWPELSVPTRANEFSGFFQLFHASAIEPPWYSTTSKHAGRCDSDFSHKFPPEKRLRPDFNVLHLGPEGIPELGTRAGLNWCGRVTPFIDRREPLKDCKQKQETIEQVIKEEKLQ